MICFDPAAGTHFDSKEVVVTNHAMNEAIADFRIPDNEAREWVRSNLRKSQYIGNIWGDGQEVRLFGYQRIAFIVALDADVVITVYARHKVDPILRNPLEEIVKREVGKMNNQLAAAEAAAEKVIAGYMSGLAAAERLEAAARDQDSRDHAAIWKAEMEALIREEEEKLEQIRQEHAKLMKGVVAYV